MAAMATSSNLGPLAAVAGVVAGVSGAVAGVAGAIAYFG